MSGKQNLTASNIRYLLAIYKLSTNKKDVPSVDVAEKLGVTKPSAHKMIKTLSDIGLVTKKKYGTVSLTQKGYSVAETYFKNYEILKSYLLTDLCLDSDNISNVIYLIFAEIPDSKLETICNSIKNKIMVKNVS